MLVIFVILRNRKMRTVTNYFLANMAIADFCVGVFCVLPVMYYQLWYYWPLGDFMCRAYVFVSGASYTASVLILMTVSVERFLAVNYPMKVKQIITSGRLRIATIVIWGIAVGNNVPKTIMFRLLKYHDGYYLCLIDPSINISVYDVTNFCVWYIVPLCIITGLYTKIGITLWRSSVTGHNCCAVLCWKRNSNNSSGSSNVTYHVATSRTDEMVGGDIPLQDLPQEGASNRQTDAKRPQPEGNQFNEVAADYETLTRSTSGKNLPIATAAQCCCCSVTDSHEELRNSSGPCPVIRTKESSSGEATQWFSISEHAPPGDCGGTSSPSDRETLTIREENFEIERHEHCCLKANAPCVSEKMSICATTGTNVEPSTAVSVPCDAKRDPSNIVVAKSSRSTGQESTPKVSKLDVNHSFDSPICRRNNSKLDLNNSFDSQCFRLSCPVSCENSFPALPSTPVRHSHVRTAHPNTNTNPSMRRSNANPAHSVNVKRRRVIRLLIAIILAFAFSVLPYHVYVLHLIYSPPQQLSDSTNYYYAVLRPIVFLFLYSNSAINPALYAFMSDNFRKSMKEAFRFHGKNGRQMSYVANATYRSASYASTVHQV